MKAEIKKAFVVHSSKTIPDRTFPGVALAFASTKAIAESYVISKQSVYTSPWSVSEIEVLVVETQEGCFKVPQQTIEGVKFFDFIDITDFDEKIQAVQWAHNLVQKPCPEDKAKRILFEMPLDNQKEILTAYRRAIR